MLDMVNSTHGAFTNQEGHYLRGDTLEWGKKNLGHIKTLLIEFIGEFVTFKNGEGNYMVTNDNGDFLPDSTGLSESGNFTINRICSYGNRAQSPK